MKLTACMMVKNEEHCLERCLNSIKDVVDEIVIVDTGSTDNTVNIAKRYTNNIYYHEWENDFAKHRNQSISYATGDWILIIDADEELHTELSKDNIKTMLSTMDSNINCVAVNMSDIQRERIVMQCNSARFFKKDKIQYIGRVHNQPKIEGPSAITDKIIVKHYGYDLSPEKMQAKFERTKELLLKQLEEKENIHSEFYLCQIYGQYGNQEKLKEWGEKYYKKREELGENFNQTIYFTLTKSYMDSGDTKRAWEIINDFLAIKKPDPDMGLAISDFGAKENRLDIMLIGCRKYLKDKAFFKENPANMGGKFFFSMRDDVERLILYRLCMVNLNEGISAFNAIKDKIHLFDERTKKEMEHNLNELGLSFLLKDGGLMNNYVLPKLSAVQ